MSFEACAAIVEKGDPDRFLAAMAAPLEARRKLFPIYAFNVEVARAPWVTQEPMIAEMRLQWWRDALEEIANGGPVRRHEVATPLADVLDADGARRLDRLVNARRWDVYKDAFEDSSHFDEYLSATAGDLMCSAALALGAPADSEPALRRLGTACGLVRFFQAVPALEEAGRVPMVDGRHGAIVDLAKAALNDVRRVPISGHASAATLEAWQAEPLLKQIIAQPERVGQGAIGLSPIRKKLRLLRWS